MKLVLHTQTHEWYGNDEGTVGRWKAKGGRDIEIADLTANQAADIYLVANLIDAATARINHNFARLSTSYVEQVIGNSILEDSELTAQETTCLLEDGRTAAPRDILFNVGDIVKVVGPSSGFCFNSGAEITAVLDDKHGVELVGGPRVHTFHCRLVRRAEITLAAPVGTWAATAQAMAQLFPDDGFDWDQWKDEMKERDL